MDNPTTQEFAQMCLHRALSRIEVTGIKIEMWNLLIEKLQNAANQLKGSKPMSPQRAMEMTFYDEIGKVKQTIKALEVEKKEFLEEKEILVEILG